MTMNQFTARKLGEVLAFSLVGAETWEKGREALQSLAGEAGNVEAIINDLKAHATQIEMLAQEADCLDAVKIKATATSQKLRAMRDLYIGDEWGNPAELLEWFGFFEGAAIVHWNLVDGAAGTINDSRLQDLTSTGLQFHHTLLTAVADQIKDIGSVKART